MGLRPSSFICLPTIDESFEVHFEVHFEAGRVSMTRKKKTWVTRPKIRRHVRECEAARGSRLVFF